MGQSPWSQWFKTLLRWGIATLNFSMHSKKKKHRVPPSRYTQSQKKCTVDSCVSFVTCYEFPWADITWPGSHDLDPGSQGKSVSLRCISFETECISHPSNIPDCVKTPPKVECHISAHGKASNTLMSLILPQRLQERKCLPLCYSKCWKKWKHLKGTLTKTEKHIL